MPVSAVLVQNLPIIFLTISSSISSGFSVWVLLCWIRCGSVLSFFHNDRLSVSLLGGFSTRKTKRFSFCVDCALPSILNFASVTAAIASYVISIVAVLPQANLKDSIIAWSPAKAFWIKIPLSARESFFDCALCWTTIVIFNVSVVTLLPFCFWNIAIPARTCRPWHHAMRKPIWVHQLAVPAFLSLAFVVASITIVKVSIITVLPFFHFEPSISTLFVLFVNSPAKWYPIFSFKTCIPWLDLAFSASHPLSIVTFFRILWLYLEISAHVRKIFFWPKDGNRVFVQNQVFFWWVVSRIIQKLRLMISFQCCAYQARFSKEEQTTRNR